MKLLQNKEVFKEFIVAASADIGLSEIQVEKDYMVSVLLREISKIDFLDIVFKGGTSLSKCYDVINRFSEDIDISVNYSTKNLSAKKRKSLKKSIVQAIEDVGFTLTNFCEIKSGLNFNRYLVAYPKMFGDNNSTDPNIIVETIVSYKPYPNEKKFVSNYIIKLT